MTSDVLRRAAARLREHAGHFVTTAWHSSNDTPYTSVRTEAGWALLSGVYSDTSRYATEYAALMHPPVALALADWLDEVAEEVQIGEVLGGFHRRSISGVLATARAILREDS